MDPRVPMMGADHSVSEALGIAPSATRPPHRQHLHRGFRRRVFGTDPLQELAIAEPTARLCDLITDPPVSVRATASQTEVVELFETHRILALPVVDFEGRLVGFIPNRSLMEAVAAGSHRRHPEHGRRQPGRTRAVPGGLRGP